MYKTKNRREFIKEFPFMIDSLQWTQPFLDSLATHQYFKDYIDSLRALSTEREVKQFILLELTREKSTCATIVDLLREDKQNELADKLEKFNRSSGPINLGLDVNLKVDHSIAPKKDLSNGYEMLAETRGLCVIVNNVEEQQRPSIYDERGLLVRRPKGLKNETQRFTSIFEQLFFDVEILTKLTAPQIKEELTKISRDKIYKNHQAFALIVISHGEDESVLGYDACQTLKKMSYGQIKDDDEKALQVIESDVIPIKELVSIFSDKNCKQLEWKPKLHFYICCRSKGQTPPNPSNQDLLKSASTRQYSAEAMDVDELNSVREKRQKLPEFDLNHTFVCYACAKEYETYFNDEWGMTYFGQALTHSIAQYACDESLNEIMTRTSNRLRKLYSEVKQIERKEFEEGTGPEPTLDLGSFAIEVNTYAMDRQLYFNPGKAEKSQS